eukprot:TRINITY_DN7056_c0_g1_i1.p1 TRINITY_DN7056_c0_g1~~TRINITY_DN7056_c0_g1_i1.p1  ORF type:complete len:323 (+),score=38.97 TRINITY_DN7056_c0_g1_i1:151-1119(+)
MLRSLVGSEMCIRDSWSGADSEEVFRDTIISHGNRDAISTIRATLQRNHHALRTALAPHVNSTLLLLSDGTPDCLELAYHSDFPTHTPKAVERYSEDPAPEEEDGVVPRSELFPTGQMDEPEVGLDAWFWPPLLWAARSHDVETCQVLLELGADPLFISPSGTSAPLAVLKGLWGIDSCLRQTLPPSGPATFPKGLSHRDRSTLLHEHAEAKTRKALQEPAGVAVSMNASGTMAVVGRPKTLNYLPQSAQEAVANAPANEYTLHAEMLPLVVLVATPDVPGPVSAGVAKAMISAGARVPPEVLAILSPDWCETELIEALRES